MGKQHELYPARENKTRVDTGVEPANYQVNLEQQIEIEKLRLETVNRELDILALEVENKVLL